MNPDTILAIGVVIKAITGLVTAVGVVFLQSNAKKTVVAVEETKAIAAESHVMINSQREAMEARIEQLSNSLRRADVIVPDTPAKN